MTSLAGHMYTALLRTDTEDTLIYEDVVVDTYLRMTYRCSAILRNGTNVDSQVFVPLVEGECSKI